MTYKKKLIEVALPLEAINRESAHEKSVPRKGHPATMHLWWARRPLAACRAILFASLVDDPSSRPEEFPTEEDQEAERRRLFRILEDLIKWENSNNQKMLSAARVEIERCVGKQLPVLLDPFCGGGSIPLEAQRLGLPTQGSDLNPVAVLVSKALVEIPQLFSGLPPVHGSDQSLRLADWKGAAGLAEDVRHYGEKVRSEAAARLGRQYPPAPPSPGTASTNVIAWIWTRTITCPNPGCVGEMPLVRSFVLSSKKGRRAWIQPVVDQIARRVQFEVHEGEGDIPEGTVDRRGAVCALCATPVGFDYVRSEGKAGRMGSRLMCVVAEGQRRRLYLSPTNDHEALAHYVEAPSDVPSAPLSGKATVNVALYGLETQASLFTPRQLLALTTFSDLIRDVREDVREAALKSGLPDDGRGVEEGGIGAEAYADAVATYLSFALDKLADWSSSICSWIHPIEGVRDTFARQAIPMVWDFVEINPLSKSVGNFGNHVEWVAQAVAGSPQQALKGEIRQLDATASLGNGTVIVCTDPPYYDNIGYADLSDFFYVWLRRTLANSYPTLFSTLLTPKSEELVATPFRFKGNRKAAERFFEEGLAKAFERMRESHNPEFPLTLFYAFKQAESTQNDAAGLTTASTGWETMLEGLLRAGFAIMGTWPIRTERSGRSVGIGANVLASSIVLVCRPRAIDASLATRREFIAALKSELPDALRRMQHGNVAPVDLAQAAIGPGMAVFSRYAKVIEADGAPMRVRAALELINQVLTEVLTEQDDEFDSATRWAISWFEQYSMNEGPFGEADVLARAKGVAVNGLVQDGLVRSGQGKVRLLRPDELPDLWDPLVDPRLRAWELTHHLVRAHSDGGEERAANLLRTVGASLGDRARDLAYRLYSTCSRKNWAQEAIGYNQLVVAWPEIQRLAGRDEAPTQQTLG